MMDVANSSKLELWADSPNHYDSRNLNFSAIGSDDEDGNYSAYSKKAKSARDPQSHRIIEKRRRDRMNNCLADLSRLLPPAYMKKGRGRIEKTEIIEMTIKHMKHLQVHACKEVESCEIARQMEQMHNSSKMDQYRSGFLDCVAEAMQFIGHRQAAAATEHQHLIVSEDFCSRLVAHLNSHCDKVTRAASADAAAVHPPTVAEQPQPPQPVVDFAARGASRSPAVAIPAASIVVNGRPHDDDIVTPPAHLDTHKVKEERNVFHYGDDQHSSKRTLSDSSNGDSDEPRSVRTLKCSSSPSPATIHTPSDSASSELDSSSSKSASQLRQMLLSNGAPSPGATSKRPSSQNHEDANGMYKFKTTIQQRFTADLEHVYPPTSCMISPSSMSSSNGHSSAEPLEHHQQHQEHRAIYEQGLTVKRKRTDADEQSMFNKSPFGPTGQWIQQQQQQQADVPTNATSPSPPTRGSAFHRVVHHAHEDVEEVHESASPASREPVQEHTENVPIFALHPKGAFYVPMSIEYSLVRTLFSPAPSDPARPLVHPVTISVNFCHPVRVLTAATVAAASGLDVHPPSVIHSPARLLRQDLVPPGLVPAVHHRPAFEQAADPHPNQLNFYALDERRHHLLAGRPLARQPADELKLYRAAPPAEAPAPSYTNGGDAPCRREYAAVIRTSNRDSRSPVVNHSSRWSHLMAKRTHAS